MVYGFREISPFNGIGMSITLTRCVHAANTIIQCPWQSSANDGDREPFGPRQLKNIINLLKFETYTIPELILGLPPACERRRYFVTTSLIGWAET